LKTNITYHFDLPDETEEFKIQTQASSMYSVLFQFQDLLRSEIKYKDPEHHLSLEALREKFNELLDDYNLTL
jgi:hypothetical protein